MSRFAIVLGAGGVLGGAWNVAALHALEQERGLDARDAVRLIGTSAGAMTAALLAGGVSVSTMLDHHRGRPLPDGVDIDWDHETGAGGTRPARPQLRLGSPALLAHAARHRDEVPWPALLYALLPRGGGDLDPVRRAVDAAVGHERWAPRPGVSIVATEFATARRRVFDSGSGVSLADAVVASCSAPLWYPPLVLDGISYVDGGVCSVASADLLAEGDDVDEIFVLTPLAAQVPDSPSSLPERVERRWRRRTTRRVAAEIGVLRARGRNVTWLTPGPEDLAAMGANMMSPARRARVLESAICTNRTALQRGTVVS